MREKGEIEKQRATERESATERKREKTSDRVRKRKESEKGFFSGLWSLYTTGQYCTQPDDFIFSSSTY